MRKMLKGIGYQPDMYSAYNRIQQRKPYENDSLNKLGVGNQANQQSNEQIKSKTENMDLRLDSLRPRVDASLEDISLSLNEPKVFDMKGRDSDIDALDIEKAVSDMQKDQALMQYQYFVGDSNPFMASEDGIVVAKGGLQ